MYQQPEPDPERSGVAAELDGIFCALWGRQTTSSRFTKFGQIRGWGTIHVVSFAPLPCLLPSNLHGQRSQDIWSLWYFCFPLFTDGDRLSWFSDKTLATSSRDSAAAMNVPLCLSSWRPRVSVRTSSLAPPLRLAYGYKWALDGQASSRIM